VEITFIGLGAMGLPMAKRLAAAGHGLHIVRHRNPTPVEELVSLGAKVYGHAAEAAVHGEMIISILPADREMEDVLLDTSFLEAVKPGAWLIEMTSGSPQMMKKVAAAYTSQGVRVLDAPVSGGTIGAEQGTLTLMIGGSQDDLDAVKLVLDAIGKNFFVVGPHGAGKAVKAINQLLAGIHMLAASEALAIAGNLQVDLNKLREVVGKSSGGSWIFANKSQAVEESRFEPGFRLNLMKKDIGIAINEGKGVSLPLSALALQLYEMAGLHSGDLDFSAVGKLIR
jgi:3-hydroxyisobutyrate dehydrogenase-like beta-hydroxyacid dehydrogenase